MFDNPKRDLARLQQELIAAEEESLEEAYFGDPEMTLEEVKELLQREDWEEDQREPLYRSYTSEDERELVQEEKKELGKKQKKGGKGGSLFLAIVMELLGIVGLLMWWLLWTK